MVDTSFFKEHGYQCIRGFLPKKKIQEISTYLHGEKTTTLKKISAYIPFQSESELIQKATEVAKSNSSTQTVEPRLKDWLSGHFPLDVRLSSILLSLMNEAPVLDLYKSIYPDEDPKVHLPPTVRFVLPKNQLAAVPPHQDVSYNKHLDDFFVMWTPFVPVDKERGGVEVFPGTQNLPEQLKRLKRNVWLEGLKTESKPIHFDMDLGDVLLLNPYIIHQSRGNSSDVTRISGDFRFFRGLSSKHSLNLRTQEKVDPAIK
ncbi:MAG: hypothetical protein S4CHLAM81_02170 [Chlamydiales bacterium]|nr:hypothetical protein [Chlamydiales bacterium]MCH9635010.1 hypothetical protein [Chlamydiales bacterium]MCH9704285.1 phytanoyl-CoA dioxygenase family protein [Chlamydiota bacterium]